MSRQRRPINKECPVCQQPYTETAWRDTKAGGYRAFRHCIRGVVTWCRGKVGQHFCQTFVAAVAP